MLLGAAGAGKSTLLETLAGVRRATSGQVLLRGADVTGLPPEARRIALVYQHAFLFPHLSVRNNIAYGSPRNEAVAKCVELLAIEGLLDRAVTTLSGGERQLVAIARAIVSEPDVLFLDEPFAALDRRRRARVRSALHSWQCERGVTVVHVTHDLREARQLGDDALVLHEGRLVQHDVLERVISHPATTAVEDLVGGDD